MNLQKEILAKKGLIDGLAGIAGNPLMESPVIFAKVKLLWQCNLSCIYCYKPAPTPPMPRRVVKELLSGLTIPGLKKIHFSGGEVFTHPDIYGILEDACNMGLQVNLTTNGTLLDKDGISKISDIGVHCVSLSLDSADHSIHDRLRGVKGAFKATVKAISRLARRERPKLRINTVLTRENAGTLDAIHRLLTGIGDGISWKILPVNTKKKRLRIDAIQARELEEASTGWYLAGDNPLRSGYFTHKTLMNGKYGSIYYANHRCYMPWIHLFADPEGFCYPCCMSRGKMPSIGKYPGQSLADILNGSRSSGIRFNIASGNPLPVCLECCDFIRENSIIDGLSKERVKRI